MMKSIFVKPVIPKFQRETFLVKLCINLYVDEILLKLSTLEKLEQILIARRIVFKKIVIMPKGQQRKIKGAICNVLV